MSESQLSDDGNVPSDFIPHNGGEVPFVPYCFLSHAWGIDELGRNNHERVCEVQAALQIRGVNAWMATEEVLQELLVENSSVVVCFLTQSYLDSFCNPDHHCPMEFFYSLSMEKPMICVPMELSCITPETWNLPLPSVAGDHFPTHFTNTVSPASVDQLHNAIANLLPPPAFLSLLFRDVVPGTADAELLAAFDLLTPLAASAGCDGGLPFVEFGKSSDLWKAFHLCESVPGVLVRGVRLMALCPIVPGAFPLSSEPILPPPAVETPHVTSSGSGVPPPSNDSGLSSLDFPSLDLNTSSEHQLEEGCGLRIGCLICGVYLPSEAHVLPHVNGLKHKTAAEQSEIPQEQAIARVPFCQLCQLDFTSFDDLAAHVDSLPHQKSLRKVEYTSILDTGWCNVCSVKVPSKEHILPHLGGRAHAANVRSKMRSPTPKPAPRPRQEPESPTATEAAEHSELCKTLFCRVCKMKLPSVPHILPHIRGKNHSINAAQNPSGALEAHSAPDKEEYDAIFARKYCTVCQVKVPPLDHQVLAHITGKNHQASKLAAANADSSSQSINQKCRDEIIRSRYCTVCQTNIPSGQMNLDKHMNGRKHAENLDEMLARGNQLEKPVAGNLPEKQVVVDGWCKACRSTIPFGEAGILSHTQGRQHQLNLSKMGITPPTPEFDPEEIACIEDGFCTVCKAQIPAGFGHIVSHVRGRSHLSMLRGEPVGSYQRDSQSFNGRLQNTSNEIASKSTEDFALIFDELSQSTISFPDLSAIFAPFGRNKPVLFGPAKKMALGFRDAEAVWVAYQASTHSNFVLNGLRLRPTRPTCPEVATHPDFPSQVPAVTLNRRDVRGHDAAWQFLCKAIPAALDKVFGENKALSVSVSSTMLSVSRGTAVQMATVQNCVLDIAHGIRSHHPVVLGEAITKLAHFRLAKALSDRYNCQVAYVMKSGYEVAGSKALASSDPDACVASLQAAKARTVLVILPTELLRILVPNLSTSHVSVKPIMPSETVGTNNLRQALMDFVHKHAVFIRHLRDQSVEICGVVHTLASSDLHAAVRELEPLLWHFSGKSSSGP